MTVQAVSSVLYLGLCIFACFTAFYRTGELLVAPVSAFLMCAFFLIMGITVGVGAGSFLIDRKWGIVISTVSASLTTCLMYIGEMILLSGHLYRFGNGILLNEIPGLVFAPVDLMIIIISGGITALIMALISRKK